MAGEFSPVVAEAETRQYPIDTPSNRSYNYLAGQINSVGNSALEAFASMPDTSLQPLAKRARDLVMRASQVNDITGRPVQSSQKTKTEAALLVADAGLAGPEAVRFVSNILGNTLSGSLGIVTTNPSVMAEEEFFKRRDEAGVLALGTDASPEAIAREGERQLRVQEEVRLSGQRIELAKSQLGLDESTYNYNKRIIQDEASSIASTVTGAVLQPFFKQIAETNLSDPASIAANRKALLQKQAEVATLLSQQFDDLGVDFDTQSQVMAQMNQRFQYMDQGMEVMAGIPAARLKQLQGVNQLAEIEQATYLGQLFSIFGPEQVGAIFDSAAIQDPNISAQLGKNLISFFARGDAARQSLRLQDTSNPEVTMSLAVNIVSNPISGSDPRDLKTLADASKTLTTGALDADYQSQLNVIDLLSDQTYLNNLTKTGDQVAVANVALFHQEMATRLATMIGQVAQQTEGITIESNPDGTLDPDWDGWMAAIERVGDAYVAAPLTSLTEGQPLVRAIRAIGQGATELNTRSTFSQLQKMVESYNKSVTSLNSLAKQLPRGLRNNNPGNVKTTPTQWQGEVPSSDPAFESFTGPDKGVRAIGKIMSNNSNLSIRDFVNRYAPPTENDTAAYLAAVTASGISADATVSEVNQLDLAKAIIKHEQGVQPFHDEFIREALNG